MGPFRSWYQYLSQSARTERRWFYGVSKKLGDQAQGFSVFP